MQSAEQNSNNEEDDENLKCAWDALMLAPEIFKGTREENEKYLAE